MFYCNLSSLKRITCFCQVNTRHFILLECRTLGGSESYFSAPTRYERFLDFYMQFTTSFLGLVAVIKS